MAHKTVNNYCLAFYRKSLSTPSGTGRGGLWHLSDRPHPSFCRRPLKTQVGDWATRPHLAQLALQQLEFLSMILRRPMSYWQAMCAQHCMGYHKPSAKQQQAHRCHGIAKGGRSCSSPTLHPSRRGIGSTPNPQMKPNTTSSKCRQFPLAHTSPAHTSPSSHFP